MYANSFQCDNPLSDLALPSLAGWKCPCSTRHLMNTTARERLTANVKELLKFTRKNQKALADHMRLSQPQISHLLNGKRQWQIEDLDRLADFFHVTPADLFQDGHGRFERRSGHERRIIADRRRPQVRTSGWVHPGADTTAVNKQLDEAARRRKLPK